MRNKIAWNKIIILHDFERSFVDRMQRTINSIQSKKTDTVVNAERDGRYVCVQQLTEPHFSMLQSIRFTRLWPIAVAKTYSAGSSVSHANNRPKQNGRPHQRLTHLRQQRLLT